MYYLNPSSSLNSGFIQQKYSSCLPQQFPGSVVGIATGYGLDGSGIESRWGGEISATVHTGPGAHPASCTMGTVSFPGVKSGRGVTLTPHPFQYRGQERVDLYLSSRYGQYSLYRTSVPVQRCTAIAVCTQFYVVDPFRSCKQLVVANLVDCSRFDVVVQKIIPPTVDVLLQSGRS